LIDSDAAALDAEREEGEEDTEDSWTNRRVVGMVFSGMLGSSGSERTSSGEKSRLPSERALRIGEIPYRWE